MDAIANHLRDPGWWFTAVIIGIIGSVVAGFTKDYLERKFGILILRSKKKKEDARLARKEAIEAWSQNEGLVTIVFLKALITAIIVVALLTGSLLMLVYMRVTHGDDQNLPLASILLLTLLIALFFTTIWISTSEISISKECFREFRRRRELPPLSSGNW